MGIFRERMKELRESRGLTQQTLAEALNIGKSAIALYETEKRQPDPDTLRKLAVYFNCSIDYLLGMKDEYNPKEKAVDSQLPTLPPEVMSFALDQNNHNLIRLILSIKARGYSNKVIEEWLISLSNTLQLMNHRYHLSGLPENAEEQLVQERKEKYEDNKKPKNGKKW